MSLDWPRSSLVWRWLRYVLREPEPHPILAGHVPAYPVGESLCLVTFCFVANDALLPQGTEVITDPYLIELWAKILEGTRNVNEKIFGFDHPETRKSSYMCRSPARPKLVKIPVT